MQKLLVEHPLKSGPMRIEFFIDRIESKDVPLDLAATRKACKSCGAFGKNWGCPPHAPDFQKLPGNRLIVICARIFTRDYPKTLLSSHCGVKMLFPETFLKPLTDRFGMELSATENGKFLSSGNCRVCQKCSKKSGLPCRKPNGRTNSLESTGVLVTDLVQQVFGFSLDWWSRTHTPEYACKVVGILT